MTDQVLLAGGGPLAAETARFFRGRGVDVQPLAEATPRSAAVAVAVIDVTTAPLAQKTSDLRKAERLVGPEAPVFSSALAVSATRCAASLERPERLAGFSPLLLTESGTVEVSRPLQAEEDSGWERRIRLWEAWGKRVEVLGDEPGLVFPRTFALMVNEAAWLLTERGAVDRDIDTAMKKGTNHPRGPLEWADRIGVDQVLWILKGLCEELGDDRYRPAPLLRRMVYAGRLGREAGRGFYQYDAVKAGEKDP